MSSLLDRCRGLLDGLARGYDPGPDAFALPDAHVLGADGRPLDLASRFERRQHYFQVRVNELRLAATRRWTAEYDPLVLAITEFLYDGKPTTVPFVVGPSLIGHADVAPPAGMVFRNTRVAGLHPYDGGRITLTIVLCRTKREDHVRRLVKVVESATKALDFSTALAAYLKVANVVLDGLDALRDKGDTTALVGLRQEIDPDANDALKPGFFVIADPENDERLDPQRLWTKDGQLHVGASADKSTPAERRTYALYSLTQTSKRTDVSSLSFDERCEHCEAEASRAGGQDGDDAWKAAKAQLAALTIELLDHPDLTDPQADALVTELEQRMLARKERAQRQTKMGAGASVARARPADAARQRALRMLQL